MKFGGFGRRALPGAVRVFAMAGVAGMLAGCGSFGGPTAPAEPPPPPDIPASIRSEELVGRWGYVAFHKPEDRARTEAMARQQCKQPYVINAGPTGGVVMHLADEAQPQELRLKGSQSGKNYIGPPGPAGDQRDREIVSFDGRVMLLRFIDRDAATRYGTGVYVRCAPRA